MLSALGNQGTERLSNLAEVTQLVRGRARTRAGSEAPSPALTSGVRTHPAHAGPHMLASAQ